MSSRRSSSAWRHSALARRNAVLMLIDVELILGGALVLLVSTAAASGDQWSGGTVLPLFIITIAAAEVALALAVILAAFRLRGSIDLTASDRTASEHAEAGP